MCGVIGIVSGSQVNQELYDALIILQHRGQDAAGIVTADENKLNLRKGNGLVAEVFEPRHMLRLAGNLGIGHVRYPTAGTPSSAEAQPMYVNAPCGISLAHNGNLTNAARLKEEVWKSGRHLNTESDSEILLNVFADELHNRFSSGLTPQRIFEAVRAVHQRVSGAYAAVCLVMHVGIVAFRDPHGIRPLVFGTRRRDWFSETMIASESVALELLGFDFERDVAPGECVFIAKSGEVHTSVCSDTTRLHPCIFEHVYLARPDSVMDGISVYEARQRMGERLALRVRDFLERQNQTVDVVVPIPETSRLATIPVAEGLGVPYREAFVKNRYIGRTFIMPAQFQRQRSVRQKLNAAASDLRGRNVLLIEDSIVRGTTTREIVAQSREAGAHKVFLGVAAPPVRFPNVYGIDMPTANELVATNRTPDQVARFIGADGVIYQTLNDLVEATAGDSCTVSEFDCSVFNGEYVTNDVSADYLLRLEVDRSDTMKQSRQRELFGDEAIVGLHNYGS